MGHHLLPAARYAGEMPTRIPLTVPASTPGADLLSLLEPYLWVDSISPVTVYSRGFTETWIEIRGSVRAPEDTSPWSSDPDVIFARANGARRYLYNRAETAICAVDDAGYKFFQHPRIEITGRIVTIRPDGVHPFDVPVAEATLELRLHPPS